MTVLFWEITSGSYSGMNPPCEVSKNLVVSVAFSIGHGVIQPLALIPLQTCIPPVAYLQPALLIQQELKMIYVLIRRAYSFTYPYTNQ